MQAPSDLLVTIVTGVRGSGATAVARALAGRDSTVADQPPPDSVVETGPSDGTATLALRLADDLDDQYGRGLRGHVVVEADPDADPLEFALILESALSPGIVLADVVASVDLRDLRRLLLLDPEPRPDDDVMVRPERLALGLETASIVVVGGTSGLEPTEVTQAVDVIRAIAPSARVISAAHLRARRPVPKPGLAAHLAANAGWMLALGGRGSSPAASTASRLVFTDPRPFHPVRLAVAIVGLAPDRVGTIARSRGLVRLATRPGRVGSWASAGSIVALEPTTMDGTDPDEPIGQELCFTGLALDGVEIERQLRAALLTDDELIAGPTAWAAFRDPFPAWDDLTHAAHE